MANTRSRMPGADALICRAGKLRAALDHCDQCEIRCGAKRAGTTGGGRGRHAPCRLNDQTWCLKRHWSLAEEVDLLPAYMVYLAGCNFRCRFCVQGPRCFVPDLGERVEPAALAADLGRIVDQGARSIILVGGEPSLHAHTLLEIAAAAERPLPWVLKTNMYMTPPVLDALHGVIPLYLADFKFGNDQCAQNLAGVERYLEVVTRNLQSAAEQAQVWVRHLLMPGHVDCCFRPVARWMAQHLPQARFHVMTGYLPAWRAVGDPALGRLVTPEEIAAADAYLSESSPTPFIPLGGLAVAQD